MAHPTKCTVLLIALVLVACGDDEYDGGPWCEQRFVPGERERLSTDECSPERSTPLPLNEAESHDICVECTPRCGATKYSFSGDEYYTDTDLPAGSCSHEGEKCDMAATAPLAECEGVVVGCALNVYRCMCDNGEWICTMTSQGGGACACDDGENPDAETT